MIVLKYQNIREWSLVHPGQDTVLVHEFSLIRFRLT